MEAFRKIVKPGKNSETGNLYITIEYKIKDGKGRLSITGVEGPRSNGDARGSCGQCIESLDRLESMYYQWTADDKIKLKNIWETWHLNDMKAGCEHQDADKVNWDTRKMIQVPKIGYGKNYKRASDLILKGVSSWEEYQELLSESKMLELAHDNNKVANEEKIKKAVELGVLKVEFESKNACHTYEKEHSEGFLSKPCPICGWKWGNGWGYREVPAEVLKWLAGLPESDTPHPWGKNG